ncbi:MAG: glycoside hydrolase, partial [Bacteroidetes bacterium]
MRYFWLCCLCLGLWMPAQSQDLPSVVRGFSIKSPEPGEVGTFVECIHEVLAPRQVNTLLLRVDYNFAYQSHPELRDDDPLTQAQVDQIVEACRAHDIRIIPQINLLGHQSWHSSASKLLQVYPQFDETPDISLPEEYVWPNADGLYCKSYCPRHPEVHAVVFAVVDELVAAFQTDAFHAGLDEV